MRRRAVTQRSGISIPSRTKPEAAVVGKRSPTDKRDSCVSEGIKLLRSPVPILLSLEPSNATLQVREIAGARHERMLFPVTCKRLLGDVKSGNDPDPPYLRAVVTYQRFCPH